MSGAINFFMVFLLGNTAVMNTEAQTPSLRVEPEQPVYITGESLSLRCVADMPRSITGYNFLKDAALIANNSASNRLVISSLSITNAGNYFCSYYKEAADTIPHSNNIDLKVIERPLPPTLSVEPQKYIFIADEPVVIRCRLPRDQSATEIYLYQNESVIKESDNFGVLSLANIKKTNTGRYTCLYKTDVSQRTIDSSISNQEALIVIDLPPTPVLRYANNLQNRSSQVEIVCEIPSPSSLINGYHLYRNGGEIASNQANRFTINYNLEFDGCYFCRSFVNILGQEILSNKSREVFLTLDEGNTRDCETQNSPGAYGLSRQGVKLYGSVLIGKLIVLISILLIFGIYQLVIRLRSKTIETEEQFHRL